MLVAIIKNVLETAQVSRTWRGKIYYSDYMELYESYLYFLNSLLLYIIYNIFQKHLIQFSDKSLSFGRQARYHIYRIKASEFIFESARFFKTKYQYSVFVFYVFLEVRLKISYTTAENIL